MKLTDHESDTTAALRLDPTAHPAVFRESWLDRVVRALAPVPVDHMPIVPLDPIPSKSCPVARCC